MRVPVLVVQSVVDQGAYPQDIESTVRRPALAREVRTLLDERLACAIYLSGPDRPTLTPVQVVLHASLVGAEVPQALVDPLALHLGCIQALEVPDDTIDPVAFELVPQRGEAFRCGMPFAVDELAQLVQVLGGVPEVHDRERLFEPVLDDVPDPFRSVGYDDELGDSRHRFEMTLLPPV